MTRAFRIVAMVFWIATVTSCAGLRSQGAKESGSQGVSEASSQEVNDAGSRKLSYNESLRYNTFFLEAVRQQNAGHFDAAFELLRHSLRINPDAAEAWFFLSLYQAELGQDSLARASMERAARLNPANNTYQEHLAQYYIGSREYDRATVVYERLAKSNRSRTDIQQMLLRLYGQSKDYDGMLRAIESIENVEGSREELTLSKMRVYEMKGDKKGAWQTLKSLSDAHPSDLNYKVMMGNWLMQNNEQKKAYKIFAAALKEEPENAFVQSSMYDYYRAVGQDSLARMMMLGIIASPKATTESKSVMMRQAISENEKARGDSTEILRLFDRILEAAPADADMAEMKVAYMTLKSMPQDSINTALRLLLGIAPENVGARMQLLGGYLRGQDWDEVVAICHEGAQYNPDEMVFYYYEGLAYYQQERKEDALEAFRRGVAQVDRLSNKELVADLYYFMGDLLHQRDDTNGAFAAYDSCLQWKPDHVACLNNYAYFLSVRGKDLHRAEAMSYKTVKEEPQNATYLDTYGWILFMQERYAEARIYIDQAVAADTDSVQSSVITEHAGDVYIMLGEKEKAQQYWQKALDAGSEHPDHLREKMREGKYIVLEDDQR